MLIEVTNRGVPLDDRQREWIDRRLRFALSRFVSRIRRVAVIFSDVNGHRGGEDQQCRLRISLIPSGEVIVEDVDASIETVVSLVSDRAARSVARRLERLRNEHFPEERVVVLDVARRVTARR